MQKTANLARWLTGLGIVVALAGIVIGVWLQISVGHVYGISSRIRTQQRLGYALEVFATVNAGAVLVVAAQIMAMIGARSERPEPNGIRAPER